MPAVQAKIKLEAKNPTDGENAKAMARLQAKTKDRNAPRKSEANWERLSQPKRKHDIVPELDLHPLAHRSQHKKSKEVGHPRAKKSLSTRASAATMSKKRQWDIGNAFSKSNLEHEQAKLLTHRSIQNSYCTNNYLSPKQVTNNALVNAENINPNELSDNFFECNDGDAFFRTQYADFESFSEYDFQTPKLFEDFELPSVTSLESAATKKSPGVLRHFKELLLQEESSKTNLLGETEVALLKDIVKADERHQQLRRDDYKLLKEILMGQLKEISQQERVIKIALKKIRSRRNSEVEVTNLKVHTAEQPMEDIMVTPKSVKGISAGTNRNDLVANNKQQVDVIFKNVPSLVKEIQILRSLGQKLEETLKKSERKVSAREKQRRNIVLHTKQVIYFRHCIGLATFHVTVKAIQIVIDIVQEFQIRLRTINELRLEKEFFMPADLSDFTLQRTSFDKLIRSPELLLRRLKPFTKDSKIKFNLIEQDPVFLNHFLTKMCKIYSETADSRGIYVPKRVNVLKLVADGGDQLDIPETPTKLEPPQLEIEMKIPSKASLTQKKKRGLRQRSKPLLEDLQVTPKNRLFRTVLIGAVQLSLLFTVISAIFYPEVICII